MTKNRSPNLTASPNFLDIAWKCLIRDFVWFLLKNIFQTVNLGLWFQRQSKWREICLVFIVLFMVSSNFQFGTLFSTLFRTSIKFSTIVHCNPVTISLIQDYFFYLVSVKFWNGATYTPRGDWGLTFKLKAKKTSWLILEVIILSFTVQISWALCKTYWMTYWVYGLSQGRF